MTGAMLGRQLSWTLATNRHAPSSSRRARAATATKPPRADAASGGGGGDEAPKKPRKVIRRVPASDVAAGEGAGSPRAPVRRRPAAPAASTSSAAPTDAPATRAKPAAKPKAKKRTVRRLKNNVAVAEATAERARLDQMPDEPEVSEKRRVEETLAAAKFKKLAAQIAADAEARREVSKTTRDEASDKPDAALDSATTSEKSREDLEETDGARQSATASDSTDLTAANASDVVAMADEKIHQLEDAKAKVETEAEKALETAAATEGVDETLAAELASALANLTGS